ncbi:DUF72 domain-containing protein [Altererythrobacter xixiisoli]|uniref:DUF72 domain-containing protein n=1 Tax=Croceibacterium xixiisoli TaxID=1476466 RepID=A0A6I4TZG5_9SPHN|nr:DUF72 domain-containing protein [Croceibacterium xixiisoli]MXP00530.1 DUF72 domain-containing protein [Croceibacterium xixiisoli]
MVIRTGIGGWSYDGWRGGVFYPEGLAQRRELEHASTHVGAIEINATFYGRQKPESFRKWRAETPDGFVFALKGSRFVTNRKQLAEGGEGIRNFLDQGLVELGDKLGPICWQLASTKRFDAEDIGAFFALLPATQDGLPLRHAVEVGHESFACAEFVDLARQAGVAIVWSEDPDRVPIADRTADFAYLRMQKMASDCPTGYSATELTRIANLCRAWHAGEAPADLPYRGDPAESAGRPGDVFAFLINGAKERAPAAAMALAKLLK